MSIRLKAKELLLTSNPYGNSGDVVVKSTTLTPFNIKAKSDRDIALTTTTNSGVVRQWIFDTNGNLSLPEGGDILDSAGNTIINEGIGGTSFTGNLTGNLTGNVTGIVNKVTLTAPTTSATITVANGKTLTVSNTLTLSGTDSSSISFGSGGVVAYTANKLSAFASTTSSELSSIISDETGTGALVFANSPTLSGTPLAPTASAGTNTTQIATTAYVRSEISSLVASAPTTLDTLNELATALGNDANYATTISTALGLKAPLANPTFTGTVSGITATMVGLGNVTNESKSTMFNNPTFTGTVGGITATMVGLGNVTNESKSTMFTTPTFTGILTASDTTEASAYNTASVILSGGLGVAKAIRSNSFVYDSKGELRSLPQHARTSAYTLALTDAGKHISITTGGVTVPASIFSIGDSITIYNNSGSNQTITQGSSVTMYLVGTATTGNRTLAQRGLATVVCVGTNTFVITGGGLT